MPDSRYFSFPFPTFQPAQRYILSMTQSKPCIITTTFDGTTAGDNQYLSGLIVKLFIPLGWGMDGADQFQGPITVISSSSFSIPLDTTLFPPLVVPALNPGHYYTAPQVIPVGENNDQLLSSTQNVLPYPPGRQVE